MERRTLLKASLASLVLPSTNSPEAVQRKRTADAGTFPISAVTPAGMQVDAEADDLPTMYNPRLLAMIEVADSMVVRRETTDPRSDVVLSFSRHDDVRQVARRIRRVVVPYRNLRTGLYARGRVRYRMRIDAAGVDFGVRTTVVFDPRARVIVYTDTAHKIKDVMGRPMWIDNTVIVATPAV